MVMVRQPGASAVERAVPGPLDPLALVPAVVAAFPGHDHVVYERDGEWSVGIGAAAEILVDRDGTRLIVDGEVRELPPSSAPLGQVEGVLGELGDGPWSAFGWVSPDLGCPGAGITPGADRLLHLVVPRTLVSLTADGATVRSGEPDDLAPVLDVLAGPGRASAVSSPVAIDRQAGAAEYRDAVSSALSAIKTGRLDKVVLSRRVPIDADLDLPATYAVGRAANTPARSVLLSLRGVELVGFCPETVVCVDPSGRFTSEPLAGTRACPPDPAEAAELARDLRRDPKEVFEHAISVRTMVEDFAPVVDEVDGVVVDDLLSVARRGSVQHLASRLRGRLAAGRTAWDAFAAAFPAVTTTGSPRAAAHTLIGELEPGPRGLYAGAAVRVDHDGGFDSALILRAIHRRDGRTWLQTGGGIVEGADPHRELEETDEKLGSIASGLVRAG